LIHLPALRGKPERAYPVTAVGETFPGTFDNYVASVLAKWQRDGNKTILEDVRRDLQRLGLSWTVLAEAVNDAEVEMRVGRLSKPVPGKSSDLVSIADVGFGVSQALPVVVALHAAEKGGAVYIEQPEIHLHPRAQVALATVLANATKRGVQVIVETHSQILLLALQTLVAKGELSTDAIILHWFTRDENSGTTTIRSAELDRAGAFGDWPEDFGQVEMDLESSYLDAAEARTSGGRNG
jgi:predicted ATPase